MARVSIGPGSALVIGLAVVLGTGNGDRLLHAVHRTSGGLLKLRGPADAADSPSGSAADSLSAADMLSLINSAVEKSLTEMKSLVLSESHRAPIVVHGHSSSTSWTILAIKCLLATGAVIGTCQAFDIDVASLMGVSRKTVGTVLEGLQCTVSALAAGCNEGLETITGLLRSYRGDVHRMGTEAGERLDRIDDELSEVRGQVADMADSVGRMTDLSLRANAALRVLCHILAENLPQSQAQQSLMSFANGRLEIEDHFPANPTKAAYLVSRRKVLAVPDNKSAAKVIGKPDTEN